MAAQKLSGTMVRNHPAVNTAKYIIP